MAAGCVPRTSDEGQAADVPQASTKPTGCAAGGDPADATPERPTPPQTLRELERALRGLGFSQRQAAAIARNGFKAQPIEAAAPARSAAPLDAVRAALQRSLQTMKDH